MSFLDWAVLTVCISATCCFLALTVAIVKIIIRD